MLTKMGLACVFGALLFGRPSVAENQKPGARTATHQSGDDKGVVPPQPAVVEPMKTAPCGQPKPSQAQDGAADKLLPRFERPEWVIVYITAIYVLIAWLTLRAIKRQADVMSAQSGHMKEQTDILRDSVAAAKESSDAAKTSALAAMGVSVPTLRISWFTFEGRPFADVRETLRSPMVGITLKNYGQSPAFLKSYSVVVTCEDLPEDPDYDPVQCSPERTIDTGKESTIGNASVLMPEISAEDIEALINRTKYMTVYGYVRFGDVFGSPLRDLKFCKRLVSFDPVRWNPAFLDWHSPKYTGQSPN